MSNRNISSTRSFIMLYSNSDRTVFEVALNFDQRHHRSRAHISLFASLPRSRSHNYSPLKSFSFAHRCIIDFFSRSRCGRHIREWVYVRRMAETDSLFSLCRSKTTPTTKCITDVVVDVDDDTSGQRYEWQQQYRSLTFHPRELKAQTYLMTFIYYYYYATCGCCTLHLNHM